MGSFEKTMFRNTFFSPLRTALVQTRRPCESALLPVETNLARVRTGGGGGYVYIGGLRYDPILVWGCLQPTCADSGPFLGHFFWAFLGHVLAVATTKGSLTPANPRGCGVSHLFTFDGPFAQVTVLFWAKQWPFLV